MKKVETILVKGTFEELGTIDLFPYSEKATQITRRNDGYNKLVFSANGFEFHRNFVDGEPMQETKVIILDDFVSTGLSNEELDAIGEKINFAKSFYSDYSSDYEDRLSYHVGEYDEFPFPFLFGNIHVAFKIKKLCFYPIALVVKNNRILNVVELSLYSEKLLPLTDYIFDNRTAISQYIEDGCPHSLDTYIAGPGEQERERLSREKLGIMSVQPTK